MFENMKANRLGAIARYYISVLGWSVIPLAIREKHPAWNLLPKNKQGKAVWEPFQTRSATPREIEWWFDMTPSNIGIVTGAISGIVVLDCDSLDAFKWVGRHMGSMVTPIAQTGKGYHVICKHPGFNVPNSVNFLGVPGLDVRGDGGYIVAPPSIHPLTGKAYEWINSPDNPPAKLPAWFFDPVQGCEPPPVKTPAAQNRAASGDIFVPTGKSFAQASFESLTDQLRRAVAPVGNGKNRTSAGNRNMELNRVGYRLGQLVGLGELDRVTVETALRDIARSLGLTDREIEATLISGVGDGIAQCDKLRQWRLEQQRKWWDNRKAGQQS